MALVAVPQAKARHGSRIVAGGRAVCDRQRRQRLRAASLRTGRAGGSGAYLQLVPALFPCAGKSTSGCCGNTRCKGGVAVRPTGIDIRVLNYRAFRRKRAG
jgi:hypothetical protein